MLKFLNFTVAFVTASILLITNTASSQPPTVSSKYSTVPISDNDEPVCYMQISDGRTLDLSRLCEKKPSDRLLLSVVDLIHEDDYMIGRIINRSNKTIYQARVNYEVISKNGGVIERGTIASEPATLNPGQIGTFQTFMPGDKNVRATFAEGKDKE
ncbi:MAG TPA: hypothetical protein V6D11_08800 [Waterburya sp.]|jgi:hypothetical protein